MKSKIRKYIRIFLLVLFSGIFLVSLWKLLGIYKEYEHGVKAYQQITEQFVNTADGSTDHSIDQKITEEVNQDKEQQRPQIFVDFKSLQETYPDVKAWLYCEGTPINYPIAQSADNEYYLHRLLDGQYDKSGTLFMDCRNEEDFTDWNTIVYGHNMKNDTMFGVIPDYMDQKFYEKHPIMHLFTETTTYEIRLIGGYVTPADADIYRIPKDLEEKNRLIDSICKESSFLARTEIKEDEKLITLSTCVYDYESSRYVLVGVLHKLGGS